MKVEECFPVDFDKFHNKTSEIQTVSRKNHFARRWKWNDDVDLLIHSFATPSRFKSVHSRYSSYRLISYQIIWKHELLNFINKVINSAKNNDDGCVFSQRMENGVFIFHRFKSITNDYICVKTPQIAQIREKCILFILILLCRRHE